MDKPTACLPVSPLRQGDAAFHGGLQASELLKDLDHASEDGVLDPGDLEADLRVELGRAGVSSPVGEHRPSPVQLLPGPGDSDDFDPAAALPQRLPEAAPRRAPGAEGRRGLVARIDMDEDGALGVQCDRQLEREAGISLRKYLWDNDLVTPSEIRVSPSVSEGRKSFYPLGLRQKRNRSVVPWRGGR